MTENKGIQSVKRTFDIIEKMAKESQSSISHLSRETGLNKTTVFRILTTLSELGYVSKDNNTDKYSLTLKFLRISANQLSNYDVHRKMRPILEKICNIVGETVHLVERRGETVVYIDKCESNANSVRMVSKIGNTLEVFSTAVGKAMLAHLSDEEIEQRWNKCEHIKKTPFTKIKLSEFLDDINSVRKQGFAIDDEENELDVRCVAVALPDAYNKYNYAVSISAPKSRTADETMIKRALLLKNIIEEEL